MNFAIVNKIINQCHVSTSNIEVIKKVMSKVDKKKFYALPKHVRKAFFRGIIRQHENNFDLYVKVMSGRF